MKKFMIMVATALMAVSASAQNEEALKEILAATDYQSALQLTEANKSSMSAEETAKAYNKVVDLALDKYNKESAVALKNQVSQGNEAYDEQGMVAAACASLNYAIVCDEYDQQPNEKGKIKPKYKSSNVSRLNTVRNSLLGTGEAQFNNKNFAGAAQSFGAYVETSAFFNDGNTANDPAYAQIAYYASLAYYNSNDFANAEKFAIIAQADTTVAEEALDVQILCMSAQLNTKEDSLVYINKLKELYNNDPDNNRFLALLWNYYSSTNDKAAQRELLDNQLSRNPNNTIALALQGEYCMGDNDWDGAIAAFKKALEIDPSYIAVRSNLGLCLYQKTIAIKEANEGNLTDEAKSTVNDAITNLNICREQDPNQESVKWAYTLYSAYYLIGDEAGMESVKAYVNN